MAKNTDRELVRRFKRGDRDAFDLLFTRYEHKVLGLMGRILFDQEEVQDVSQEVFVRALRALPGFRGESNFYTWLYRIALNVAKNHTIAKNRRPPFRDIDATDAEELESGDSLRDQADPESLMTRDELFAVIARATRALPDELRHALILRELDRLSYEQIATIMQCPVGTVRSRVYRAREALHKRIRPLLEKDP